MSDKAEDQKPKRKNKGGRPRILLDEKQLTELAFIHCTYDEMAAVMDCSVDTIRKYSKLIEKGREQGKTSLRRAQWKSALAGDKTMLIWLGKQELAQKDRTDIDMSSGVTILVKESHVKL